ncbi:sensor histidine kinase [Kineococcus rhizosphaerae]|uniref:Histidine kinase n=1 Tax=Kineococcus rhizosphaerae TaxID=559628 RepID=A0A2T0QYR8_9ACTN|nr:sensor histidine kinase [Kineococcus rhizosphaerae]PRY11521.1 histidine kinase [Kineococcus rhizosphaerae]
MSAPGGPVDLLEAARPGVADGLRRRWSELPDSIQADEVAGEGFLAHADAIFDLVLNQLRYGDVLGNPVTATVARARAQQQVHPRDSLLAARILHEVILRTAQDALGSCPEAVPVLCEMSVVCTAVFSSVLMVAADEHLTALLDEVNETNVAERRRIARELHDQTGHGLAVAQRQLELAEKLLVRDDAPPPVREAVDAARSTVVETMRGVRGILEGLRADDEAVDLRAALEHYITGTPGAAGVSLTFSGDVAHVPTAMRREIFLMVRECLRNAQRHAHATTVALVVEIGPSLLMARTVDDGVGFAASRGEGAGMTSLRERAALLGARVEWLPNPGGGTTVLITVPLPG